MKYICLLFVLLAIMFSYGQKFTGKFDRISYLSGNLQHDFKVSKLKLKEVITKNEQKLFRPKDCASIFNKYQSVKNGLFSLYRDENSNFGKKVFCYFEKNYGKEIKEAFTAPRSCEYKNFTKAEGIFTFTDGLGRIYKNFCNKRLMLDIYGTPESFAWSSYNVIHKRLNSDISFNRTFEEFENGFGDINGNYWLGLKNIRNIMTTDRPYLLKISWVNESGIEFKSNYNQFRLGAAPNYDLNFFKHTEAELYTFTWLGQRDLLKNQRGAKFSTFDVNQNGFNMASENESNKNVDCAEEKENSWWFRNTNNKCGGINANAYNYEDMNWDGNKVTAVQISIMQMQQKKWWSLPPVFWSPLEVCNSQTCVYGNCVSTKGNPELEERYPHGSYCKCEGGWTGDDHCSKHICHTQNLCKNNGGCLISTEEPFYKCRCDIGYTGDRCELKTDSKIPDNKTTDFMKNSDYNIIINSNTYDCTPLLCNGICTVPENLPDSGTMCWPDYGFRYGDFGRTICQVNPNEWWEVGVKQKCENGSGCIAHNYWPYYSCACLEGYYGKYCQYKGSEKK